MLRSLKLENFKSFKNASMKLGPFTILVGTNASGKSNIRDAFRFLHGIGRGYSLAEIIGEKWGEAGVRQWSGIRGGLREIAYGNTSVFGLKLELDPPLRESEVTSYQITIEARQGGAGPQILSEGFSSHDTLFLVQAISATLMAGPFGRDEDEYWVHDIARTRPVITQLLEDFAPRRNGVATYASMQTLYNALGSMRFLDLGADAMRLPSIPGQIVLGDRGENLSSVLQAICAEEDRKIGLISWLRELTPMDVVDFEFPADQTGRVLLTLVEEGGRRISAYSASDGTLRFLAMLAALLGPESAGFYFFEELENGLHPTRLALLLQLIEQQTAKGKVQVVATTHSAELLSLLSPDSQSHVIESYRREDSDATDLTPVVSLPDARRVIAEQGLGRLHASGWIEDAVAFAAPEGD